MEDLLYIEVFTILGFEVQSEQIVHLALLVKAKGTRQHVLSSLGVCLVCTGEGNSRGGSLPIHIRANIFKGKFDEWQHSNFVPKGCIIKDVDNLDVLSLFCDTNLKLINCLDHKFIIDH